VLPLIVAIASDSDKKLKKISAIPMDEIVAAVAKLSPEEATFFLTKLQAANRKRRIQLWGYLISIAVWALTMFLALLYYAYSPVGEFVGWVFVVPFVTVAVLLILFGKWADTVETLSSQRDDTKG
jgi:membrane protein insertase Oxa1/YidC/SpoIIIJ